MDSGLQDRTIDLFIELVQCDPSFRNDFKLFLSNWRHLKYDSEYVVSYFDNLAFYPKFKGQKPGMERFVSLLKELYIGSQQSESALHFLIFILQVIMILSNESLENRIQFAIDSFLGLLTKQIIILDKGNQLYEATLRLFLCLAKSGLSANQIEILLESSSYQVLNCLFSDNIINTPALVLDSVHKLRFNDLTLQDPKKGFILSCWMKFQSNRHSSCGSEEEYPFFELLTKKNALIVQFKIYKGKLQLEYNGFKECFELFTFQTDVLYNISVSYETLKPKNGKFTLHINAKKIQAKFTDVLFKDSLSRPSLFSSFKSRNISQAEQLHLIMHGPTLTSNTLIEVTSVTILNISEPTQPIVSMVYHLGPSYAGYFQDHNIMSFLTPRHLIKVNKESNNINSKGDIKAPLNLFFERCQITLIFSVFNKRRCTNNVKFVYWTLEKGLTEGFHSIEGYLNPHNASLLENLDCIGGTDLLLEKIANTLSKDDLYFLLRLLFFFLDKDRNSQKLFAFKLHYNILANVLKTKKQILSLDTLKITLEFVGYNHIEPIESVIYDTLAYGTLICDFEIWDCHGIQDKEILEFLLLHFTIFIQNSKYKNFNLKLIVDKGITKKIVLALKENLFDMKVLPIVQNLLSYILKNHSTAPLLKSLERYVIFSLEKKYEGNGSGYKKEVQTSSGEMVLEVLVLFFSDFVTTNEKKNDIYKLLNQKWLLACLCGSSKMKQLTIKLIIILTRHTSFTPSKLFGSENIRLSSYFLKHNWNDEYLKILLFAGSLSNCSLAPTSQTLIQYGTDTQNLKCVSIKSTEFLLALNCLMVNASLELEKNSKNIFAYTALDNYIDFLNQVRLMNNDLNTYIFTNTLWIKGTLFIISVLKEINSQALFQKYDALLKEIVTIKLLTVGENDIHYIEKLCEGSPKEFNTLIIPIIITFLSEADSPFSQISENSKKEAFIIKILYKYLKSYIVENFNGGLDAIRHVNQIGMIIERSMQLDSKFELKKNVVTFLELFCSAYLTNLMLSSSTSKNVEVKLCLETFMTFSGILMQHQSVEKKVALFTCFVKMLTTQEFELQSVIINCMRVFIIKLQQASIVANYVSSNNISSSKLNQVLENFAHWNDEQVIKTFALDQDLRTIFVEYFNKLQFGIKETSDLQELTSCIEPQYEQSITFVKKEIQPFIDVVFNAELKSVNRYLQDSSDDVKFLTDVFDNMISNIPDNDQTTVYALDLTEGKYRKRSKFVKIQNTKTFQFYNLIRKKDCKDLKQGPDINDSILLWLKDDTGEELVSQENKNRSVLRNLIFNDQISEIHNVVQVIGLDTVESILIIGFNHIYLIGGYFCTKNDDIIELVDAPENERDTFVKLLKDVTNTNCEINLNSNINAKKSWPIDQLLSVSKRQFLLRDTAFELFFEGEESILLTFNTGDKRNDIYNKLNSRITIRHKDINLEEALHISSQQRFRCFEKTDERFAGLKLVDALLTNLTDISLSDLTERWCQGEVSNFYYLMLVNTIAGRTFNDLTQYPVFPFVINDYESKILDLKDTSVFRDLKKPMGAQEKEREIKFKERYEAASEMGELHPFHYGTHYSSAMIVASYLIRIVPFTDFYLNLQGGKFDHADRLFSSVSRIWKSASNISTDVRELIPEFYYLPDFLVNSNGYDMGETQDGIRVSDVELPPWADGDPIKFVEIMREALESDYVSQNLNHWIDLIFGYKQQGEEAISATNVFHGYSYPGNIDLSSIADKHERSVVTSIIHNFGQTPLQIFHKPHPSKKVGYKSIFDFLEQFGNEKTDLNCIFPTIDEIIYDCCQSKWIPLPWNLKVLKRTEILDMKVIINEPNNVTINGKYQFEHLIFKGYITSCCILANGKFLLGFSNGIIKLFEVTNNVFNDITNAFMETMIHENKIAKNLGIPKFRSNYKKSGKEDRLMILNEILTFRSGKNEAIIKLKYWKTEGVFISMGSNRDCLILWIAFKKKAIHEVRRIEVEDLITDFDINFEDNYLYVIDGSNQLTLWTINGQIVSKTKVDKEGSLCLGCLENLSGKYKKDYSIFGIGFEDGSIRVYSNEGKDFIKEISTGIKNVSALNMVFVDERIKLAVGGEKQCYSIE